MLYRPPGAETDARSVHQTLPFRVSQEEVSGMGDRGNIPALAASLQIEHASVVVSLELLLRFTIDFM